MATVIAVASTTAAVAVDGMRDSAWMLRIMKSIIAEPYLVNEWGAALGQLKSPKADVHRRQLRLRVVRHLPVCAEPSKPDEAWGQVLDKPPGRKPRGRADADQQGRGAMGI